MRAVQASPMSQNGLPSTISSGPSHENAAPGSIAAVRPDWGGRPELPTVCALYATMLDGERETGIRRGANRNPSGGRGFRRNSLPDEFPQR